ncbi:MAG: DUF1987 domain-containing protein [Bacteroidota bacterium]|nr:DUF1987 domain-containing protein [Bacteroidota bacterium]
MESLIIKKTEETPAIIFNPKKNIFQLVATSWPENAKEFYAPVISWLDEYFLNTPLEETIFQFRLNYMNTASAKQVARILSLLKKHSSKHKIIFQWYYEKGDWDMLKEAKRLSLILNINFIIIEK